MYHDAKEELKRLEDALLEEDPQPEEYDISQWNFEEALSDIPDLPEPPNRKDRTNLILILVVIFLTLGTLATLAFLIYYGGISL